MELDQLRAILTRHREELKARGVKSLAVFGSVARGEARPDSDVDILVEFDRPVGLFEFVEVKEILESLLGGVEVDLVVRSAVIEELKQNVYGEAVHVL